jgi:hypothetical protein
VFYTIKQGAKESAVKRKTSYRMHLKLSGGLVSRTYEARGGRHFMLLPRVCLLHLRRAMLLLSILSHDVNDSLQYSKLVRPKPKRSLSPKLLEQLQQVIDDQNQQTKIKTRTKSLSLQNF